MVQHLAPQLGNHRGSGFSDTTSLSLSSGPVVLLTDQATKNAASAVPSATTAKQSKSYSIPYLPTCAAAHVLRMVVRQVTAAAGASCYCFISPSSKATLHSEHFTVDQEDEQHRLR